MRLGSPRIDDTCQSRCSILNEPPEPPELLATMASKTTVEYRGILSGMKFQPSLGDKGAMS